MSIEGGRPVPPQPAVLRDNVLVAVRVRSDIATDSIIDVSGNNLVLHPPRIRPGETPCKFSFDRCYSASDADGNPHTQQGIFDDLGQNVLDNAFKGYNVTLLAYGQTGSGKSYCMMGSRSDPGLIPRISKDLFSRILINTMEDHRLTFTCEASYFEIYNEKVRDLLDPSKMEGQNTTGLLVREHPKHGPYVEDLSIIPVQSYEDIDNLLRQGNTGRTVAATRMNAESSRSHAIFTIILKQNLNDKSTGSVKEKISRVHLVDLAGSERQTKTKAHGSRLKEASEINKSLVTLGRVISALSEAGPIRRNQNSSPRQNSHIPFRDSTLTWLLKNSFGINGNARTMLLCTISPRSSDYEETLGSLRYAARAKRIITTAVCNEDANTKLIDCLKNEIKELNARLGSAEKTSSQEINQLASELDHTQKLISTLNMSWEDKVKQAESIRVYREQALERDGIAVKMDSNSPFLCNLNEDPGVSECLIYYLKKGSTHVGRSKTLPQPRIYLHDLSIPEFLCVFTTEEDNKTTLTRRDARFSVFINGKEAKESQLLHHGDRIIFGKSLSFRYSSSINSLQSNPGRLDNNKSKYDWEFAQAELKAKLDVMMNDLQKEREEVSILRARAMSTGEEFTSVLKQLETERQDRAELSQKLQKAVQESTNTRATFEEAKNGFNSLNQSQQLQLLSIQKELQKERSIRAGLSRDIDHFRRRNSCPSYSPYTDQVPAFVRNILLQSIYNRRNLSKNFENYLFKLEHCNCMAQALGHCVFFELRPQMSLSPKGVLLCQEFVFLRSVLNPEIIFTSAKFLDFYYRLREYYCDACERHNNPDKGGNPDPVEYVLSQCSESYEIGFGVMHQVKHVLFTTQLVTGSSSILDGDGNRIACLYYSIAKRNELPSIGQSYSVYIKVIGVDFLSPSAIPGSTVQVLLGGYGLDLLEFNDVPVMSQCLDYRALAEGVNNVWVIDRYNDELLKLPLQIRIMGTPVFPRHMDAENPMWVNARCRHSSHKRVSVLKTPSIGTDGSIRVPGPSPRLLAAQKRVINGSEFCGNHKPTASGAKSRQMNVQDVQTRLHVLVEIQELSPSTGVFDTCSVKANSDYGGVFRVCLSKPKRFNVRIAQTDTQDLSLESCSSLKVVAVRSGSLRDTSGYECDISQEQAQIHDKFLSFRCLWPTDMAQHSYAQRGAVFELDLEISVYVDWQLMPIILSHTVACKAYARIGFLRSFMNNISSHGRHCHGSFYELAPSPFCKTIADLREAANASRSEVACKLQLEKMKGSLHAIGESSPSDSLFAAVLETLCRRGGKISSKPEKHVLAQASAIRCADDVSCPERAGYIFCHQRRIFSVLRYPFLHLYRDANQTVEDEFIDLISGVIRTNDDAKLPFTFSLQTKVKTYSIQASCDEDFRNWIRCFSNYLPVVDQ
uniref:Kinesin motor domain-containing protein n=1 Tax=Spongospora subterranea TaxID=70186 RepID=A0A0H5QFK3_9EUKA|eukprot:CRZ00818.1 hypothetical protein [Spongospora subterranea]